MHFVGQKMYEILVHFETLKNVWNKGTFCRSKNVQNFKAMGPTRPPAGLGDYQP